jgi:hypothetical protein
LPVVLQEFALWLYAGYLNRLYYGRGFAAARSHLQLYSTRRRSRAAEWQDRRLRAGGGIGGNASAVLPQVLG